MEDSKFIQDIKPIIEQITTMLEERNKTYGDKNLLTCGYYGLVIRTKDKLSRIVSAIRTIEELQLVSENTEQIKKQYAVIEEALEDIAGYAINGLRLKDKMPTGVNDLWD